MLLDLSSSLEPEAGFVIPDYLVAFCGLVLLREGEYRPGFEERGWLRGPHSVVFLSNIKELLLPLLSSLFYRLANLILRL